MVINVIGSRDVIVRVSFIFVYYNCYFYWDICVPNKLCGGMSCVNVYIIPEFC
jgi:hypothetical protein